MNSDQDRRLSFLKVRWCPFDFIAEYYGLDFRNGNDPLIRDYAYWLESRKGEPYREGKWLDRYWLEMFLQTRKLLSRKWAATQVGMSEQSLISVLKKLDERGPILRYHLSEQVIGSSFPDDLWESFPDLKFFNPSGHDSFCSFLHEQIEKQLGIRPEPEWCRTAAALGKQSYAKYWDAIGIEPVSVEYEVWLDLKKWMTLSPDRTSLKTYAENEGALKLFVAGTTLPEIPGKLRGNVGEARQ